MEINKSKAYLVPLLDTVVSVRYPALLLNSYAENRTLSLLYKYSSATKLTPDGREGFPVYEEELINNPYFVEKKDLIMDGISCVLYTFNFPEKYLKEYDHFMAGRYSLFSVEARRVIIKFLIHNYPSGGDQVIKVKQVLTRDEKLRQQLSKDFDVYISKSSELSSIPDPKKEKFYV